MCTYIRTYLCTAYCKDQTENLKHFMMILIQSTEEDVPSTEAARVKNTFKKEADVEVDMRTFRVASIRHTWPTTVIDVITQGRGDLR
jgi:hypothetical protein